MKYGARNRIQAKVKSIKKGDVMSLVKFTVTLENAKLSRAQVERIAKGSGTQPEDVRALIQQYNQMRATFKKLRNDRRFARMFKGMADEETAV